MELDESTAHAFGISETDGACDLLHRLSAILQSLECGLDTQALDGSRRCFAGFSAERAAELPGAEMHGLGQALYAQRL
jgi:hypothetical protein